MFHSVGNENENWYRNWLSVSLNHFENFCEFLSRNNYETVLLEDWYICQAKPRRKKSKQVVLTFDDGYLDNWIYVYPILKKYKLKGTIFINPEFVDPSAEIRPNLMNVWEGTVNENKLSTLGFLNWAEIKALDASGVMDIQSHSMSHNFYFLSDKIIDIYDGQPKYDWLSWYERPETKPFSITEDQKKLVPYGNPIFKFGRALGLRRYFPDERLIQQSIESFSHKDGSENKESLIIELNEKLEQYPGHYETDKEMAKRYHYELIDSKKILEEKLNKKIEFLCWPGGGYNELSIELSKKAGYKASTISSRDRNFVLDNSGNYKRIKRFGMGSFISTSKRNHYIKDSNYLVSVFLASRGSKIHRNSNRLRKLLLIIWDKLI